jgi:hypothetical protein
MPYVGRSTDKISNVEVLDNITFDGSSSYTLQKNSVNFTPSSANTLLVSIDGVVQAGNFTVSGSTIDFGTAVAGTSTCNFILHYGIGLITTPADGTVTTAKLASSLDFSSKTITLASNMKNTPAFVAYKTSNQSLSNLTSTKITFTGEQLDTNSNYDTVNSSFTPSIAGYYFIGAFWRYDSGTNFSSAQWILKKNGTSIQTRIGYNDLSGGYNYNYITYANGTDYFEMFGYQNSGVSVDVNGSGSYQSNATQAYFYGYRLIGA